MEQLLRVARPCARCFFQINLTCTCFSCQGECVSLTQSLGLKISEKMFCCGPESGLAGLIELSPRRGSLL